MTKLGKLCMAIVLALVLAPSALAGITDYPPAPGTVETPPAPHATATGIIDTPPSAAETGPTDSVANVAFDLLLSAIVLF